MGKMELVRVVIGDKVWQMSRKMAMGIIDTGKAKYKQQGQNAILGVEKDGIITLQNETFDSVQDFVKEVSNWEKGGFKCYFTTEN